MRTRHWHSFLRDPRWHLPALLLLAFLAPLFAWQMRPPALLDIGGSDDRPYLTGFHAPERASDGTFTYRWSQESATVIFPGYGATASTLLLRLQGDRPDGSSPTVTLAIGKQAPLSFIPNAGLHEYRFPVPASAFQDGALRVILTTPAFQPRGDARTLGVVVDVAELYDDGGPAGLILPPVTILLLIPGLVLLGYVVIALLLRAPLAGFAAGGVTLSVLVVFAVTARPMLSLFIPTLALIALLVAALTCLIAYVAWRLRARYEWTASERALGGMALITGMQLLLLLAGVRHPQFQSSDLLLNVHRLEFVQRGEWIFTLALPGARALEAPYPPLFYAVMLPFAAFIADKALLVEVTAACFVAIGVPLTFALGLRATSEDAPALWAAGIYALLPITYGMASAGNFANLFGQGVATLYLVLLALTWSRWTRPLTFIALTVALLLALLGHFGVFLSLLVTLPLLVVILLFSSATRRQALALAASFAIALLAAWALYYHFHTALLLGHLGDFLAGDTNARGAAEQATLWQRLRNETTAMPYWWGWPALPLGIAGINLLPRNRPSPATTLTLGWLSSLLPFIALALIAGLSVRYHLFVAAPLAIVAGWALWQLWRAHRLAGPLAALLLGGFWAWQGMTLWIDRVLHAYH